MYSAIFKTSIILCVARTLLFAQAPTDNPVASYYSGDEGYPAWTDRIAWDNAIDMSAYTNGANEFEKFENARDELYSQGGGVLYYPAGTYDFSDMPADGHNGRGMMLKRGVVVRGETPAGDADASDGSMALGTKFTFGFQLKGGGQVPRDWNIVGLMPDGGQTVGDINDVGVVWVEFTGATVYFGFDANWGATWATAGSWKSIKAKSTWAGRVPDGTHPWDPFAGGGQTYGGAGSGRIVFGCAFKDACVLNDAIDEGFGANGFWMYRFGPRIGVYGDRIFVANNAIPQSSKNFKYSQNTSEGSTAIMFDYALAPGIDINKCLLGFVRDNGNCDGYYKPAVIVRDNFVFNHGNKGYEIAGEWVSIINNKNDRIYLKEASDVYGLGTDWNLTLDGYSVADGSSDNMSRAFDPGGRALWIDNNRFTNTGSDPGNDGEGILCQFHGGTQLYSWALTRNVHEQGSGEPGYMGGYDVCHYGYFAGWNTTSGSVGSMNNKACGNWDFSAVQNTATKGVLTSAASGQVSDVLVDCPSGIPQKPSNVGAEIRDGDYVYISWQDNADNEIAFRVDRKIGNGAWTAIAYRPRKSAGTEHNLQAWADFTAPRGKELSYRVAAVNCDDDESGASDPTGTLTIGESGAVAAVKLSAVPAPGALILRTSRTSIMLELRETKADARISVIDPYGRSVLSDRAVFSGKPVHIFPTRVSEKKLAPGLYLVRVEVAGFYLSKHFIIGGMP